MPSHLPSDAFFLNAIEEIYDKDTSLFIYSKKYSCTSTRGLGIQLRDSVNPGDLALVVGRASFAEHAKVEGNVSVR
jgi:hypothetical protein